MGDDRRKVKIVISGALLVLFGIGMAILSVNLIIKQYEISQAVFVNIATVLISVSSFVLGILRFDEYVTAKRQMSAEQDLYSEYSQQQKGQTLEKKVRGTRVFKEHKSMFWEIYWCQVEIHFSIGFVLLLICGACAWLMNSYVFSMFIIVFGFYMISGLFGISCIKLKKEIKAKGMNAQEVKKDYAKGVMYTLPNGYFNIAPKYTFIIQGTKGILIRNDELLKVSVNKKITQQSYKGVNMGEIKEYSIVVTTKNGVSYDIGCDTIAGVLISDALNEKIEEYSKYQV